MLQPSLFCFWARRLPQDAPPRPNRQPPPVPRVAAVRLLPKVVLQPAAAALRTPVAHRPLAVAQAALQLVPVAPVVASQAWP